MLPLADNVGTVTVAGKPDEENHDDDPEQNGEEVGLRSRGMKLTKEGLRPVDTLSKTQIDLKTSEKAQEVSRPALPLIAASHCAPASSTAVLPEWWSQKLART